MRAPGSEIGEDEQPIAIEFEGQTLLARRGETLAAALTAHGIQGFRITREGENRGLFCGIGVCQECLVEVQGQTSQRACMFKVKEPVSVRKHRTPTEIMQTIKTGNRPKPSFPLKPDVLVVGGGAAGLSAAAAAARGGASVVMIDERPIAGGQYFKQPHTGLPSATHRDDKQFAEGRDLIAQAQAAGVTMIEGLVASASLPLSIMAIWEGTTLEFKPERLVVATGAFERPLPVPGWNLPGVMTTGAAQTLLRSNRVLSGKRVVVAGNGPLNLQVACELKRAGADVAAVAELAPVFGIRRWGDLASMAFSVPSLLVQGAGYINELRRNNIPVLFNTTLKSISSGLQIVLATDENGTAQLREFEANSLCMNYGFLPNNELLRLLRCEHKFDQHRRHLVTVRDKDCRTTVANVLAAGDCCGLSGVRAAMADGEIGGMIAASEATGRPLSEQQNQRLAILRREREIHQRFQKALWRFFLPAQQRANHEPSAIVCRCENVSFSQIQDIVSTGSDLIGSIKRQSRMGMGRCQGRYCVPEMVEMICNSQNVVPDESTFAAPRPPIKPVPISAMSRTSLQKDPF